MINKLCILVCEHYEQELAAVVESEEWDDVTVAIYPPRCGRPPIGWDGLRQAVRACGECDQVHVLGGGCLAALGDPPQELARAQRERRLYIRRLGQCFYRLAGREMIDDHVRQGDYLLTPGWLADWRRQLEIWGFDGQQSSRETQEFFGEFAARLLLLDTGVDAQSGERLRELADFVARPCETLSVGLDMFRLSLTKIVLEWRLEKRESESRTALNDAQKRAADSAIALDMLGHLPHMTTEPQVVAGILEMFSMLFAPGQLRYAPFQDGEPRTDDDFQGEYAWTESGQGFRLRIGYRNETLGILEVDKIAFPEYKEQYLNLALVIANVCGLAISNAHMYQHLERLVAEKVRELELERAKVVHTGKLAAVGELATGVAHELNQPLTAMLFEAGYLKTMVEKPGFWEKPGFFDELHQMGENLEQDIGRCRRIINHLRDFGRTSEKQAANVNLNEPIEDSFILVGTRLRDRGVEVHVQLAPDLPLIMADTHKLEQVFLNLISNAEYAMEERKREGAEERRSGGDEGTGSEPYRKVLEISTYHTPPPAGGGRGGVVAEVRDNGCSIPEADQERIFEPFFSTKPVGEGTGLGLSISYGIVTEFGGEISFESVEGAGTTFTLRFPVSSET